MDREEEEMRIYIESRHYRALAFVPNTMAGDAANGAGKKSGAQTQGFGNASD